MVVEEMVEIMKKIFEGGVWEEWIYKGIEILMIG